MIHGDSDTIIKPDKARQSMEIIKSLRLEVCYTKWAVGVEHHTTTEILDSVARFIQDRMKLLG
jgi:hypothetical protein